MRGYEFQLVGCHSLGVGTLPGRKRPLLYKRENATITTMATFRNEEEAKVFLEWLKLALLVQFPEPKEG